MNINRNLTIFISVGVFSALMISMASGLFSEVQLANSDADLDEIEDALDNCPKMKNTNQTDFDSDSLGNPCDIDDDNDVVDKLDAFDINPEEWADFDFDGVGNKMKNIFHNK